MANGFMILPVIFSWLTNILMRFVFVALVAFVIIKLTTFVKKRQLLSNKKVLCISLACIFVATMSVIFNIGWLRVIMVWTLIPIIQPILFLVTNLYAAKHMDKMKSLKFINTIFIITYVLFWIFLPDFGDVGPSYFFFNLVRKDAIVSVALAITVVAGIAHFVLFIIQIIQFVRLKKSRKGEKEYDGND